MNTLINLIRLLIFTVIFVPPCFTKLEHWMILPDVPKINSAIQEVVKEIEIRLRLEDNTLSNISGMIIGSPFHGQLINSMPSPDGHSESRTAEIIFEATRSLVKNYCLIDNYWRANLTGIVCAKDLTNLNLTGTTLGEMCMSEYHNNNSCIGKNFDYRSYDGSCNNLEHKYLGKANTPYKRLLFPVYADGVYEMPDDNNELLPNPRIVSQTFVKDEDVRDNTKTTMMAYWSMFIGHDLSHTAMSTMGKDGRIVNCCDMDKNIQFSLYKNMRSCKPIFIPNEDKIFKPNSFDNVDCMNYVRSRPAVRSDCTLGPMEQMNQATHYLDASMIYGTTEQKTLSLRKMSLGQLLLVKDSSWRRYHYMPVDTSDTNVCQNGNGTCFRAGDIRANAYPQLSAVYTLWMREHNRVALELYKEKLFWNDEQLFREARKIVTACIQHITYNEWLPALLGVNYTKENGLGLEQRTTYDKTADPSVSNSFATAILPFANSMISDKFSYYYVFDHELFSHETHYGKSCSLKSEYNRPLGLISIFQDILKGLVIEATQKVDMMFTQTITNYLYSIDPNELFGMDILSLDIQRSRDHGIPSYTQFRKYCGLKDIENVQDLSEIMMEGSTDRLLKLYKSWNDIDLLVGALLERHVDDAMVGPTMRCIIREQFVRTRIADRYFYDVPGVFSDYQLENIKKVTLARVLCDNSHTIFTTLNAFLRSEIFDRHTHNCKSTKIPKMNFSGWFDKPIKLEDNYFATN